MGGIILLGMAIIFGSVQFSDDIVFLEYVKCMFGSARPWPICSSKFYVRPPVITALIFVQLLACAYQYSSQRTVCAALVYEGSLRCTQHVS